MKESLIQSQIRQLRKTCDDCVSMLEQTGVCYCGNQNVFVNSHELKFPRGSRFGVVDIQANNALVVTTDSLAFAQRYAQTKGYYRLTIQL